MEKLIFPCFHSLAMGLFPWVLSHSLSPCLQACLATSCFVLVLSCCVLPLMGLTCIPFSCRHVGENGDTVL